MKGGDLAVVVVVEEVVGGGGKPGKTAQGPPTRLRQWGVGYVLDCEKRGVGPAAPMSDKVRVTSTNLTRRPGFY